MMWSALYQQRPAPEEGEYFKAAWLRPYATVPAKDTLAVYGASDYAVTANGGDYTVHVVVGVDPDGADVPARPLAQAGVVRRMGGGVLLAGEGVEAARMGRGAGTDQSGRRPFIERMQRERQAFVYRRAFPTRGDKAVRAQSIRGRMALHGLYVPQNAHGCRVAIGAPVIPGRQA